MFFQDFLSGDYFIFKFVKIELDWTSPELLLTKKTAAAAKKRRVTLGDRSLHPRSQESCSIPSTESSINRHIVFIMDLGLIQIPANLQDKEQFNRPLWTANIKGSDLKAGLRFVTNIDKMERNDVSAWPARTHARDGTVQHPPWAQRRYIPAQKRAAMPSLGQSRLKIIPPDSRLSNPLALVRTRSLITSCCCW